MIQSQKQRDLVIKSIVILGLWTVVILLISSITILTTLQEGSPVDVFNVLLFELICISPWIVLTPAIMWLARSYKFEGDRIFQSIGMHLIAIFLVFSIHSVVQSYTVSIFYDMTFNWSYIQRDFLGFIDMRVMLYAGILLGVYALDFHKKNREIRLEEPRLKAELNRAKFHALLNQIQPDFLLKTLDSIKASLDGSEEAAEEILTEFSDLLRIMLANVKKDEVILQEDLRAFELYIHILEKRLGMPIRVRTNIDKRCLEACIPSFLILIPVFERIIEPMATGNENINEIFYNAGIEEGLLHLEIVIEGVKVSANEMPDLLRNTEILKIVRRYRSKYEEVDFKTKIEGSCLRIELTFPYLPAQSEHGRESPFVNKKALRSPYS